MKDAQIKSSKEESVSSMGHNCVFQAKSESSNRSVRELSLVKDEAKKEQNMHM